MAHPNKGRFHVRKSSAADKAAMVAAYASGENCPSIARRHGLDTTSVHSILKARGVVFRDKHARSQVYALRHDAFSSPLSEEAIYWIGMLMSDGCVSVRGESFAISLGLNEDDHGHVDEFRKFLGSDRPVAIEPPNGSSRFGSRGQARLSVNSVQIACDLARYGVVPRKSLIADPVGGIELLPAYWAGAVDGDGHLMWKGGRPTIGITGSLRTTLKFRDFIRQYSPAFDAEPAPQGNVFHLRVSNRLALPVIKALYENRPYALARKREMALRIIREYEARLLAKIPPPACSVGGCDRKVRGLGFCSMHYRRYRKHGSPFAVADAWNAPRQTSETVSPLPIRKRRSDAKPDGYQPPRQRQVVVKNVPVPPLTLG